MRNFYKLLAQSVARRSGARLRMARPVSLVLMLMASPLVIVGAFGIAPGTDVEGMAVQVVNQSVDIAALGVAVEGQAEDSFYREDLPKRVILSGRFSVDCRLTILRLTCLLYRPWGEGAWIDSRAGALSMSSSIEWDCSKSSDIDLMTVNGLSGDRTVDFTLMQSVVPPSRGSSCGRVGCRRPCSPPLILLACLTQSRLPSQNCFLVMWTCTEICDVVTGFRSCTK